MPNEKYSAVKCENALSQWRSYATFYSPDLEQARNVFSQESSETIHEQVKKAKTFTKKLSKIQLTIFTQLLEKIKILQENYKIRSYAEKLNLGNCGEHTEYSLYKILEVSQKLEKNIRLQKISLDNKDGGNHAFIIIDNLLPDITINNNPKAVAQHLKKLHDKKESQGYICDTWNEGYFKKLSRNKNHLYNSEWNSLQIQTITLDLDFSQLPKEARQFLRGELKKTGFKNLTGKTFVSFSDRNQALPRL
jgi:hypothetical protein